MIFQHSRFQVWNASQHPYKHNLNEFFYTNPALPGVTSAQGALDWINAVLYPQSQPAVATPAALPAVGNTINDMRTVTDDGDGKAASYRWEQREGEASPSWHKIYDLDWGTDSILQGFLLKTQDIYVKQWGYDDLDAAGSPVVGTLAGQSIYGGASANTNLSLFANSGDGAGPNTGFVQTGDNFRPTSDSTYSSGTATERWLKTWAIEGQFGTMTIEGGSITDTLGTIDFDNEDLTTVGTVSAFALEMNDDGTAALPSLFWTNDADTGLYLSSVGVIGIAIGGANRASFRTDGLLMNVTGSDGTPSIRWAAGTGLWSDNTDVSISTNSLSRLKVLSNGNISFNGGASIYDAVNARWGFGTATPGSKLDIVGSNDIEQLSVRANSTQNLYLAQFYNQANSPVFAINTDGHIQRPAAVAGDLAITNLGANSLLLGTNGAEKMRVDAAGNVGINVFFPSHKLEVSGDFLIDNLLMDGNTLSSNNANGDIIFDANGTGHIIASDLLRPSTNGTISLGASTARWDTLYLATGISDGTTTIASSVLQSLRSINTGVAAGMTIFWSGTQWLASAPDTEIDHGTIGGLLDDDHNQYALLSGRVGGQALNGGTAASNNLALSSTSHATKGFLTTDSVIRPTADGTVDFGTASFNWKDAYITGQLYGARIQNATTAGFPAASAGTIGRIAYDTDKQDVFIDRGGTWKKLSLEKYVTQDATGWTGTETTATYTVSSEVSDARECVWVFKNNSDSFKQIGCDITMTQTQVTVTVDIPLAAGTYTLVGVG